MGEPACSGRLLVCYPQGRQDSNRERDWRLSRIKYMWCCFSDIWLCSELAGNGKHRWLRGAGFIQGLIVSCDLNGLLVYIVWSEVVGVLCDGHRGQFQVKELKKVKLLCSETTHCYFFLSWIMGLCFLFCFSWSHLYSNTYISASCSTTTIWSVGKCAAVKVLAHGLLSDGNEGGVYIVTSLLL